MEVVLNRRDRCMYSPHRTQEITGYYHYADCDHYAQSEDY